MNDATSSPLYKASMKGAANSPTRFGPKPYDATILLSLPDLEDFASPLEVITTNAKVVYKNGARRPRITCAARRSTKAQLAQTIP